MSARRTDTTKAVAARRGRGFEPAAGLLRERIRKAGETRGFAVARLVTHWAEVAGPEIAAMCRPLRVSYGRGGFGGTLTLLVSGAQAPVVQMQLPRLRDRVNACYGFNAIARIRLTQTAPEPGFAAGFAEAQTPFTPAPAARTTPPAEVVTAARSAAGDVADDDLRSALEALARNVLSRTHRSKGS